MPSRAGPPRNRWPARTPRRDRRPSLESHHGVVELAPPASGSAGRSARRPSASSSRTGGRRPPPATIVAHAARRRGVARPSRDRPQEAVALLQRRPAPRRACGRTRPAPARGRRPAGRAPRAARPAARRAGRARRSASRRGADVDAGLVRLQPGVDERRADQRGQLRSSASRQAEAGSSSQPISTSRSGIVPSRLPIQVARATACDSAPHPQDVGRAVGDGDRPPRVEQVEGVRALEHLVVGGQRQARLQAAAAPRPRDRRSGAPASRCRRPRSCRPRTGARSPRRHRPSVTPGAQTMSCARLHALQVHADAARGRR